MTNTIYLEEELEYIMDLMDSQKANLQKIQIQNLILINEINEIESMLVIYSHQKKKIVKTTKNQIKK